MKNFNREAIQRMFDGRKGGGGGGTNNADLAGYATQMWVNQNYVSIEFFNRLFSIHGHDPEDESTPPTDISVLPNDMDSIVDSIESMVGFYTEEYLSALGLNPDSGSGNATTLYELLDVKPNSDVSPSRVYGLEGTSADNGKVLTYSTTYGKWIAAANGAGSGSVTSIDMTVPTGFSVSGAPITTYGTLAVTFGGSIAKNKVLASPANATGSPDWRTLVASDIPDLSATYASASDVTTLQGYFDNLGNANSANKLAVYSKTAWGQTYWTSGGVPDNISGDMTSVGDIMASSNGTKDIKGFRCLEMYGAASSNFGGYIDFHYNNDSGDYTSRIIEDASGVLKINNTIWATLSGDVGVGTSTTYTKLTVNGGVKTTKLYLYKPNTANDTNAVYFEYDSANAGVHLVGAGFYGNSYISALGLNPDSGGGSITLNEPLNGINNAGLSAPTSSASGQTVVWNGSAWTYSINTTLRAGAISTTGGASIYGNVESSVGDFIASAGHGFVVSGGDHDEVLLADGTKSKLKTVNGYSLFGSGNIDASGGGTGNYLPLSGGTITSTSMIPLGLTSSAAYSTIRFTNSSHYRTFGIKTDGTLFVTDIDGWNAENKIIDTSCTIWGASFYSTGNITNQPIENVYERITFSRESWNYICVPSNGGSLAFNIGVADSANTKMYLTNGGNVGIGTTSPSSKLSVVGNASFTSGITVGAESTMRSINMGANDNTSFLRLRINRNNWAAILTADTKTVQLYLLNGTTNTNTNSLTIGENNTTFNKSVIASSFSIPNGTSSQFLKADGSVDSNTYALSSSVPTTLDNVADGATRKLANYLPLTGGEITGTTATPFGITTTTTYSTLRLKTSDHYRTFGIKSDGTLFVTNLDGWSSEYKIIDTSCTIWGASFYSTGNITNQPIENVHERITFSRESWNYICVPANGGVLAFNVGGADTANTKMCVLNNGNVGIGTTSPYYTLDIVGDARATNFRGALIGNADTATSAASCSGNAATATILQTSRSIWGQSFDGSGDVTGDITVGNGNIYLNNNKYIYWKDSLGTNRAAIFLSDTNNFRIGYGMVSSTVSYNTIITGYNVKLTYGSSRTDGFILNSSGNVGIGVASPSYKLHVDGTVGLSGINFSNSDGVTMDEFGNIKHKTSTSGNHWHVDTSSNQIIISATTGGSVGIGTNTPSQKLEVNGNIATATSDGTFIKIGALYIVYDSANNALRVAASATGSTAANFYATGAVSALGANTSSGGAGDYIPLSGSTAITGSLVPATNNTYDLGSSTKAWGTIYANSIAGNASLSVQGISCTTFSVAAQAVISSGAKFASICIESTSTGGVSSSRVGEINRYNADLHLQFDSGTGAVTMCQQKMKFSYVSGSGSTACYINTSNTNLNIDIGTATAAYCKLFQSTSDIRKKDIISNVSASVDSIANAPIFNFRFKGDPTACINLGTSAQYWRDIFPCGVTEMGDGYLAMGYGNIALAAAVVTARKVQNHEDRIRELEERLSLSEAENKALREEIELLKAA